MGKSGEVSIGGRVPTVLAIAGSDSGGGAGIQADIKAVASCGAHAMTAITAITAQNTLGVRAIDPVSARMILEQIRALIEDMPIDAVKVGMLGDVATVMAVAEGLDLIRASQPHVPVVADPVMVSETGSRLLAEEAIMALKEELIPRSTVLTPNIPEARALSGSEPAGGQRELAEALRDMGAASVVVTGGHSEEIIDVLVDHEGLLEIEGERVVSADSHGSGCTHSSAFAASLAKGYDIRTAARSARRLAARAVARGLSDLGKGAGPVNALAVGSDTPQGA